MNKAKDIQEGNKLIAESPFSDMRADYSTLNDVRTFMGYTSQKLYNYATKSGHTVEDLRYHCDWNWLMPVIEKIESHTPVYAAFIIQNNKAMCTIMNKETVSLFSEDKPSKLEAAYDVVIQFIKWYNQNKTS